MIEHNGSYAPAIRYCVALKSCALHKDEVGNKGIRVQAGRSLHRMIWSCNYVVDPT